MTIYAAAAQKSRAYGYLFIHCNNYSVNTQYILGEKQTSISQQGRGSPVECPTQRTRPAIVQGCALCYHAQDLSLCRTQPRKPHSCVKCHRSPSPDEKLAVKQVKSSKRKCSNFVPMSILNKKCEKLSGQNDTEVKLLLKGYKFYQQHCVQ